MAKVLEGWELEVYLQLLKKLSEKCLIVNRELLFLKSCKEDLKRKQTTISFAMEEQQHLI
jgi:hypothetical protein